MKTYKVFNLNVIEGRYSFDLKFCAKSIAEAAARLGMSYHYIKSYAGVVSTTEPFSEIRATPYGGRTIEQFGKKWIDFSKVKDQIRGLKGENMKYIVIKSAYTPEKEEAEKFILKELANDLIDEMKIQDVKKWMKISETLKGEITEYTSIINTERL